VGLAQNRKGAQASDVKKTRILLLGPKLNAVSGVSTHLNQLLESTLANDFDLGHFPVGSEGRKATRIGNVARLLFSPILLAIRIIRDRPEIVHINVSLDHKSFPRDATYLLVARALCRKIVLQVHGGELPKSLYPGGYARTLFVARILRAAQAVVLLGKSELAAYSEFAPEVRLHVIANAIKLDPQVKFREVPAIGPLHLTFVGRLAKTKGVAECIEAARLLKNAGRNFRLTVAGSGPEETALKERAKALGLEDDVEFVGAVFGADKDRLWRESDLFLFPSFHHEGLPYALLESMAAGTVPITTRVGAQPDVMEDGAHGLFVPSKNPQALFDAIVRLDDDRMLLLAMSQHAIVRIREQYCIDRLSSQFRELYRSLEGEST
jgi:glycosyltransferase involved in cell wall biosynthesis